MSFAAAVLIMVSFILGFCVLALVISVVRHEKDAWLGRRLVDAAGSEELANLVIVETTAERLARERFRNREIERAFGQGIKGAAKLRLVKS